VSSTTSATSALITDLARRAQYGAAHGVFGTVYDVGDAFGPIAAGFLVAALGYAGAFRAMSALALLCAAVFYAVSRQLPR
jgi:MFS family permease